MSSPTSAGGPREEMVIDQGDQGGERTDQKLGAMSSLEDMSVTDDASTAPPEGSSDMERPFVSSPDLLLGKGDEMFIPVQDGEVSTLHRGCQGAQHLWVSLRLPRHAPDEYAVELQLVDELDSLLAPPYTLTEETWLAYRPDGQDDEGSEILGLTLVIFDPMSVVGREALVKAKVTVSGETLESRVWVEVQWGADAC